LQECQRKTTSKEFLEWMDYIEAEETESFHREDYYYALIASEVRRSYVKDPHKVCLEDMLLKFTQKSNTVSEITSPAREEDKIERKIAISKSFWMGMLEMKGV